jgi:hypothetical protein
MIIITVNNIYKVPLLEESCFFVYGYNKKILAKLGLVLVINLKRGESACSVPLEMGY